MSAPGREASMRAVVEAIDGPMSLNVCLGNDQACPRRLRCPAHPVWVKAQEALLEVLNQAWITDLADGDEVLFFGRPGFSGDQGFSGPREGGTGQ
jgi:DNA-binding IscR family transcriptional regulator